MLPNATTTSTNWSRLYGSAFALAIVETSKQFDQGPVVVIVEDIAHADSLTSEIKFYGSSSINIFHLPDWETLPYDVFSPHQDIVSERLKTLYQLQNIQAGDILLLPVTTLLQKLTPKKYISDSVLIFEPGQKLDTHEFRTNLESAGYSYVSQVMEHGEFTVRGSIIDIFPSGSATPFRIDLFDDEIESIRSFDPGNQRSDKKIDAIELLPAREFPTDKEGIKIFRENYRQQIIGDPLQSIIYSSISDGLIPTGIEYYLPLFFNQLETTFDYLPDGSLFIQPDNLNEIIGSFTQDLEARYEQRRHDIERPILPPQTIFLGNEEFEQRINRYSTVNVTKYSSIDNEHDLAVKRPPELKLNTQAAEPSSALTAFLQEYTGRILFVAETPGRREILSELLRSHHIYPKLCESWNDFVDAEEPICLTVFEIENGLNLLEPELCVITEPQIYGQRAIQKRRRKKRGLDPDAVVKNLTDLNVGSPVVHLDHGVGRYLGLQKLSGTEFDTEFLTIEYAGGDKLYVPVSSLHLISRYTGASQEHAPIHRLGTEQWQKAKSKAIKKARDVAAELLDIHARRAAAKGRKYEINHDEYQSFCNGFPFEETEDQETTILSVLEDLSNPTPMDRVVCGDVGFGKTEVAMRAAFAVANTGKQVAILVPTTLLAQQHYQNFSDRFADWPIKVEGLTRFNSAKKQQAVLDGLESGKVDIVVGTHKLLQKTVKYKDLGLVIIDEEHRFGVKHKEQMKSLRSEVDILTLTATPIPRTLNMSLAGIRDLSIIATPPHHRHSINTFVSQWDDVAIKEACQRELKRGGQIYFLHNEVKTIEKLTNELKELLPEAKIAFAHGQMPEKNLEQIMLDFYHQRYNILVATTIIESGIDVPTANTIIINRADKLGLSQLHQIRGRVGRSHHRAYAYLITPPESLLTDDAKKRLDAIESLEDLGVGFTLATHDLEIRGAGELLGENQSGQITEIGFSLYSELLEKAVESLKKGESSNVPLNSGVEIDLGMPAIIPDDYVHDIHLRLILYKRIASAKNSNELDELRVEFIDRFGLLPDSTKNLFAVTEVKLLAEKAGISKVDSNDNGFKVIFTEQPNIDPAKLIELIQTQSSIYQFNGTDTLRITNDMEDEDYNKRTDIISQAINTLTLQE
ncbi:MAG: transcription-repair coupling factor [Gammaproteobacteria bacterium]|nr:transcription-repair coupling factor [Gammaproteobacteria bacterium]